jgi:hypothetical protein
VARDFSDSHFKDSISDIFRDSLRQASETFVGGNIGHYHPRHFMAFCIEFPVVRRGAEAIEKYATLKQRFMASLKQILGEMRVRIWKKNGVSIFSNDWEASL